MFVKNTTQKKLSGKVKTKYKVHLISFILFSQSFWSLCFFTSDLWLCFHFLCALGFQHLRHAGVAGRFVEFFGPGVSQLSAPDRTTIANMCPEYNATISYFPVDQVTLKHFKKTSESPQ